MVSIQRAPLDYLIESLLEPSKKIKKRIHTNLVTLKNGDAHAGGIVSEQDRARDPGSYGQAQPYCQSRRSQQNDFSGFLMPVGLTAQCADEFVDLVRSCRNLAKKENKDHHQPLCPSLGGLARGSPNPRNGPSLWSPNILRIQRIQMEAFYAIGGGIPVDEVPVALKRERMNTGFAHSP